MSKFKTTKLWWQLLKRAIFLITATRTTTKKKNPKEKTNSLTRYLNFYLKIQNLSLSFSVLDHIFFYSQLSGLKAFYITFAFSLTLSPFLSFNSIRFFVQLPPSAYFQILKNGNFLFQKKWVKKSVTININGKFNEKNVSNWYDKRIFLFFCTIS